MSYASIIKRIEAAADAEAQIAEENIAWFTNSTARAAIVLRDGCACTYCGTGLDPFGSFDLDHYVPQSKGGAVHDPANLVASCASCNRSRQDKGVQERFDRNAARRARNRLRRPVAGAFAKAMELR